MNFYLYNERLNFFLINQYFLCKLFIMSQLFPVEQYLQVRFDPSSFLVTAIGHPHTYINKILLGSQQGTLQLWNIHSNRLIYSFTGWGAPVTAIEQV